MCVVVYRRYLLRLIHVLQARQLPDLELFSASKLANSVLSEVVPSGEVGAPFIIFVVSTLYM